MTCSQEVCSACSTFQQRTKERLGHTKRSLLAGSSDHGCSGYAKRWAGLEEHGGAPAIQENKCVKSPAPTTGGTHLPITLEGCSIVDSLHSPVLFQNHLMNRGNTRVEECSQQSHASTDVDAISMTQIYSPTHHSIAILLHHRNAGPKWALSHTWLWPLIGGRH